MIGEQGRRTPKPPTNSATLCATPEDDYSPEKPGFFDAHSATLARHPPKVMAIDTKTSHRPEDSPTAWFCELERARQRQDLQRAAEAQRQLERLGVRVRYQRPRERKAADHV